MSHNITVEGGTSVRLPTAGKYCDRDIVVTATGNAENLDDVIAEQAELIEQLSVILDEKSQGVEPTPTQEKTVDITENGTVQVVPDDGFALSKVTANVNVPIPEGYIQPSGTLEVTENGTHDVTKYASVAVNVPSEAPNIQPLEITENGTYTAPSGVDGYSPITVNVEASGGGGDTDLPSGCRRVDYIQFSGKELIDTGIIGNQDTQINAAFTWESSTQNHVFGCASPGNTASITSYTNGSWRFGNKSQNKSLSSKNPKLPYSALVNKSTISLNSSVTSISGVNDFETIGTLLVGGARGANGDLPSSGIVGKIFYFILWQGEEQILKLISVVDADGNYHFWDVIGKKFYDSITETPLEGGNL